MRPPPEITAIVAINVVSAIAAFVLTVACSRADDHRASTDLNIAGRSVDSAAANVAHNTAARSAEAELKTAGHDAAKDIRKAAAEAKVEAHKLASGARGAAHDVTHHDSADDKNS